MSVKIKFREKLQNRGRHLLVFSLTLRKFKIPEDAISNGQN